METDKFLYGTDNEEVRRRSFIDSDTALILFLVLILKKEGADPAVILALLYILT
ncbi:MAG: hypothetical protein IKV21_03665 [Clostridia bacterium]|nr:hypothetical protein [Clostridia bacterium]